MKTIVLSVALSFVATTAQAQLFTLTPQAVYAPQYPQTIQYQPYQPITVFRWGWFGRRLVPRTYYVPARPQTYVPQPQPEQAR